MQNICSCILPIEFIEHLFYIHAYTIERNAPMEHAYIAIDLKSFYASVECVERGLDPLTTNLVVADNTRTDKTICLAVSAGLKTYGLPGRPRLFEVIQAVISGSGAGSRSFPGT